MIEFNPTDFNGIECSKKIHNVLEEELKQYQDKVNSQWSGFFSQRRDFYVVYFEKNTNVGSKKRNS